MHIPHPPLDSSFFQRGRAATTAVVSTSGPGRTPRVPCKRIIKKAPAKIYEILVETGLITVNHGLSCLV